MRWSLLLVLLLAGCGLRSASDLGSLSAPVMERPALAGDATSTATIDRRIADLQGQLATAQADRRAAQQQAQEAERAAWRTWTRWIAVLIIPLAVAAAVISVWFGFARLGIPIAGAAAVAALALQAWAEALAYLAWTLPVLAALGLVVAVIVLVRQRQALAATAGIVDALERVPSEAAVVESKAAARAAQVAAGVHGWLQRMRGRP